MSYTINSFSSAESSVGAYEKNLSICLTSNGFSFSVITVRNELLSLGEVACDLEAPMHILLSDIKGIMESCKIPTIGLHRTRLVVNTNQFVWIPQHLYDKTQRKAYLEALYSLSPSSTVFDNYNDDLDATIVFAADNSVVSTFKVAFPGLEVSCQHELLVNSTTLRSADMKSLLVVNLREGAADYCAICNKKLQLSNTFPCANFEEAVYHALNITKQLHLDDIEMTLALCGDIDEERFTFIQRFFRQVALYNGSKLTILEPSMHRLPLYRYATTLS